MRIIDAADMAPKSTKHKPKESSNQMWLTFFAHFFNQVEANEYAPSDAIAKLKGILEEHSDAIQAVKRIVCVGIGELGAACKEKEL